MNSYIGSLIGQFFGEKLNEEYKKEKKDETILDSINPLYQAQQATKGVKDFFYEFLTGIANALKWSVYILLGLLIIYVAVKIYFSIKK